MRNRSRLPVVLTIAGSDSGGGAGIQADLKTFAALQVHGTSAISCVTAQNPKRVSGVQPCSPAMVRRQIAAVFEAWRPAAVKTGMLFSGPIIHGVVEELKIHRPPVLIVDPVMIATSGGQLLKPQAVRVLKNQLLPLASLVTPNLDEAEVLVERRVRSVEAMRSAARELQRRFGCAALVKGGHLAGLRDAIDIFYDGRSELLLQAPRVKGLSSHGTGCTYAAAIAGYVARGYSLERAVVRAKEFITNALLHSSRAGRFSILNSFWLHPFTIK